MTWSCSTADCKGSRPKGRGNFKLCGKCSGKKSGGVKKTPSKKKARSPHKGVEEVASLSELLDIRDTVLDREAFVGWLLEQIDVNSLPIPSASSTGQVGRDVIEEYRAALHRAEQEVRGERERFEGSRVVLSDVPAGSLPPGGGGGQQGESKRVDGQSEVRGRLAGTNPYDKASDGSSKAREGHPDALSGGEDSPAGRGLMVVS